MAARSPASVLSGETTLSRLLRYLVILTIDGSLTAASLLLAFLIRFEVQIPPEYARHLPTVCLLFVAIRVGLTLVFGVHRWSFRMSGFYEALRLAVCTSCGSAMAVAAFYFLQRYGPPRSVIVLEFFLTTSLMAVFRFSPRLAAGWYVDQKRTRRQKALQTIVVGAGSAGDLLVRDLMRSDEHLYDVVGFVDDDRRKIGTRLYGRPVLGRIEDLPELVERHAVTEVLIAIPRLSAERIQTILKLCGSLKVHFKIIPVSFAYLNDRIAASMLHDLRPEDLLPRQAASFDTEEIRAVVSRRRTLVTGAAGSIGSEIARQVAVYGPESLVLLDMNENDLYFLYRELREQHPELKVVAEVADIRESERIQRVCDLHRPHYVFHAAAHKHVPLMEDAPEEAVKNNVFGTLNVALAAARSQAERFILISTDKAVHPSSVMGATKRVAELVVRDLAKVWSTRFTAIRFGNVLGSAGSVVPLFRQQIERGGPVTVTHPGCERYFMTVAEAVGLVLLAGLGDYGELCVLDMGHPIKIVDLAAHLITMAGLAPGVDIRIEFTGLRPGEKLTEELMTEEEEESRVVRDKIYAASSPPPTSDLAERLRELQRAANKSDRPAILLTLKRLVPTFVTLSGGPYDGSTDSSATSSELLLRNSKSRGYN